MLQALDNLRAYHQLLLREHALEPGAKTFPPRAVELLDHDFIDDDVVACRLPAILTPGEYTISIWLGSSYENLEQHENIYAFTVEGDDLGRLRRLITISTEWRTMRLDDHVVDS